MRFVIGIIFFISGTYSVVLGQCCSPGNPVAGSANLGVVGKKNLRVISFFRNSYSDQYYEGAKKSDYRLLKRAGFNYLGAILGYGITPKLTAEIEAGYFIQKYQVYNLSEEYRLNGRGFASGVISGKYNIFSNFEKGWEITLGAGAKVPFSQNPISEDNVLLPQELQPTSGAFGGVTHLFTSKSFLDKTVWLILLNRSEFNGANPQKYRYGNSSTTSLVASKRFKDKLALLLALRHEYRDFDKRNDITQTSTGGNYLFLTPQINYNLFEWNVSCLFDLPIYRKVNGRQLAGKYAFSITLLKSFCLSRVEKTKPESRDK